MPFRRLINSVLLTILLVCALAGCAEQVRPTPASEDATLHIALAGSAGAKMQAGAVDALIRLTREPGFLSSPGVGTQDPLAPCALLAAEVTSEALNIMFYEIAHPGKLRFPPPGSNILGLYDADMARGNGTIPRDDPAKAADIIARLVVYRSWMLNAILNTLITPMTQQECLTLLTNGDQRERALSKLRPSEVLLTHAAPVSAYFASCNHEEGDRLISELLQPSFLEKPSSSVENPLSPCSLLRAFRLAARLNDAWNNQLSAGKFDVTGRPELEPYGEDLRDGKMPKTATARSAEVMAAVFAAEILRANDLTSQLICNATQRQCLDELFQPGTLRFHLMQQGITLPLR